MFVLIELVNSLPIIIQNMCEICLTNIPVLKQSNLLGNLITHCKIFNTLNFTFDFGRNIQNCFALPST